MKIQLEAYKDEIKKLSELMPLCRDAKVRTSQVNI